MISNCRITVFCLYLTVLYGAVCEILGSYGTVGDLNLSAQNVDPPDGLKGGVGGDGGV
jgi:hypothetical protein